LALNRVKTAIQYYILTPQEKEEGEELSEKLFYPILIKNEIPDNYQRILRTTLQTDINNINYLKKLLEFNLILQNDMEEVTIQNMIKIKQFYDYCFIQEKCPPLMILWTVSLLKIYYHSI
jgi:hypothetical protein